MLRKVMLALRFALSVGLMVLPFAVEAQQAGRVWRIGSFSPAGGDPALEGAFLDALRNLGYVEGNNLIVERRYAYNRVDRLPVVAAELVDLKVDLIIATGTVAPLAVKKIPSTIPVVIWSAGDPVGTGIVASLARPGGNITGLTIDSPELAGKRLQLLKEMLPGVARVGVIWNAANPYSAVVLRETQKAALLLGIAIQSIEVRGPSDFDSAFGAAVKGDLGGLVVVEDPLTFTQMERIVSFAATQKLPVMYGMKEFVSAGGLIAYGPSYPDLLRRAAIYVDKILKGANPAELPIEQPTKFELAINAKTAKAIGTTVPQSLLLRADEIVR
jgi:putative tryptophan/tyrosine transport system substrate-binding protein